MTGVLAAGASAIVLAVLAFFAGYAYLNAVAESTRLSACHILRWELGDLLILLLSILVVFCFLMVISLCIVRSMMIVFWLFMSLTSPFVIPIDNVSNEICSTGWVFTRCVASHVLLHNEYFHNVRRFWQSVSPLMLKLAIISEEYSDL